MKWSKKYSSKLLNINMLYLDANALKRGDHTTSYDQNRFNGF